jgi:hypothetical protein
MLIPSAAICSLQYTSRRWSWCDSRATGVREAAHCPHSRTRRCQRIWVKGNSAGSFVRAVNGTLVVPGIEWRDSRGWSWNIVRLVAPWYFLLAMSITNVPLWRSEELWLCRRSWGSFIRLSIHRDRDSRPLCHRDVHSCTDVRIGIRVDRSSHPVLVNCENEQLVYKNWNMNWSYLMEEFLPLLPTGLMVCTFKTCIQRVHGDVCVCVRACVRALVFRHRNCCIHFYYISSDGIDTKQNCWLNAVWHMSVWYKLN